MLTTVEGIYRDGRVELMEQPAGVREARVFVTFTELKTGEAERKPNGTPATMRFGMFGGDGVTSEDDFKLAEWRGENLD